MSRPGISKSEEITDLRWGLDEIVGAFRTRRLGHIGLPTSTPPPSRRALDGGAPRQGTGHHGCKPAARRRKPSDVFEVGAGDDADHHAVAASLRASRNYDIV